MITWTHVTSLFIRCDLSVEIRQANISSRSGFNAKSGLVQRI